MGQAIKDLTGMKFNRLTVEWFNGIRNGNSYWNCVCECWVSKIIRWSSISWWAIKSCWCINKGIIRRSSHLMSSTRIYKIHEWIKKRCNQVNYKRYKDYWGRWISYDPKRESFEWFYEDMWPTYQDWLTIDRIDNDWNYCKENCRWATRPQQDNNKRTTHRLEYDGKKMSVTQRSDEVWINENTIFTRLFRWWSVEKALTTPT